MASYGDIKMVEHIKKIWNGEVKFWKAFWFLGVFGNLFLIFGAFYWNRMLGYIMLLVVIPFGLLSIQKCSKGSLGNKILSILLWVMYSIIFLYLTPLLYLGFLACSVDNQELCILLM